MSQFKEGITGFIRIPTAQDPNKVFALGPGGMPVKDPEHLIELTGAATKEEAFGFVKTKTQEEARALGVRLPGTEKLFPDQPDILTPEMLDTPELQIADTKGEDLGGKAVDSTAGLQGILDFYTEQQEQLQASLKTIQEQQRGVGQKIGDFFAGRKTQKELLEEERKRWNIPENWEQIQTLLQEAIPLRAQIVDLEARKDLHLLDIEGRPISMEHIRGEMAIAERQWNSRINASAAKLNAKNATITALQGNVAQARALVSETVNAMVYDQKWEYTHLKDTYDINQDIINKLDKTYQNALKNALNTAKDIYEEKKDEATKIANLSIDAAEKYGISLDLTEAETYEEAVEIYNRVTAPFAAEEREAALAATRALTAQRLKGERGPAPIVINGDTVDLSSVSGLQKFKDAGGGRETAKVWLDLNTKLTEGTIDDMLNKVYGLPTPTSVSGQNLLLKQDLVELSKRDVTREQAKEVILEAGFDSEGKEWESFLDLFSPESKWYKPWTWDFFTGKGRTAAPATPSGTQTSTSPFITK